jgi:hypothetical protein
VHNIVLSSSTCAPKYTAMTGGGLLGGGGCTYEEWGVRNVYESSTKHR